MVERKFENCTYPTQFVFIVAETHDEVRQKYAIDWNEHAGTCFFHDKIYIIIHPDAPLDVLVHECDHAVSLLWMELGIKKLKGIDECYSYMLGWLFKKCNTLWKKNN